MFILFQGEISEQFGNSLGMTGIRLFCNDFWGEKKTKGITSMVHSGGEWKGNLKLINYHQNSMQFNKQTKNNEFFIIIYLFFLLY